MPTPRTPKWVSLSNARERLCDSFGPYFELFVDELLANAILSQQVPLQAVTPSSKSRRIVINVRLVREPDYICILENKLCLKNQSEIIPFFEPPDFILVELDWRKLVAFVHARRVKIHKPSDPKVGAAFARSAARHQKAQTRPSRSEHLRELRQELPSMTKDQYERARKQAIVSGTLPPGWGKSGRIRNNRRMNQLKPRRKSRQEMHHDV
jgi:hypothetical protein